MQRHTDFIVIIAWMVAPFAMVWILAILTKIGSGQLDCPIVASHPFFMRPLQAWVAGGGPSLLMLRFAILYALCCFYAGAKFLLNTRKRERRMREAIGQFENTKGWYEAKASAGKISDQDRIRANKEIMEYLKLFKAARDPSSTAKES